MNYADKVAVTISNSNQNVSFEETICAIEKAGFKHVFIEWYNKDFTPSQEKQLEIVREAGFIVDFAHLGYQKINSIWEPGEIGDELVKRYQNDLKVCKSHGISHVCMHLTSKTVAPDISEIGLHRIKQITDTAKELDMTISFENTKIKKYVDQTLLSIQDEHVGFCFDSGHYHAHFQDDLDFKQFKNRILAVHLHDNHGISDEHLIPFEGNLDWSQTLKNLKDANYQGRMSLELVYRNKYCAMSVDEFYQKGFESAVKLAKSFNEIE